MISKEAKEFFTELAEGHDMYPDTVEGVIDRFVWEWESRERIPEEYRTIRSK